jgi:L-ascorbate metabolism protein UlaG (beta-lactamase superfamily)
MRCRWLGWAGVELEANGERAGGGALEAHGERIVIDALGDPAALYRLLGGAGAGVQLPEVVQPATDRPALAALVTHLHRDHADAPVIAKTLAPGASVLLPARNYDSPGVAQAIDEFARAELTLRPIAAWETVELGPFAVTALPAADGTGEEQLSWAVAADRKRIVHCGDTAFHGWWWPAAEHAGPFDVAFLPVNGAVVNFPWRQPASPFPAAMDPDQAVVAAAALGAKRAVPIHFGGFDLDPFYRSIADADSRFLAAAAKVGVETLAPEIGVAFEL